ncbi:VanZ family protein [Actinomycetota bacterium Odt1-20B]
MLVVLAATIAPTEPIGSGTRHVWLIPGDGLIGAGSADLFPEERRMILALSIANAAMFVPLAMFWHSAVRRPSIVRTLFGCFCLSMFIEMVQFVMNAGRVVDIDDVLFNTLGSLVGIILVSVSASLVARSKSGGRHSAPARGVS